MNNIIVLFVEIFIGLMLIIWIVSIYNHIVVIRNNVKEWEGNIRALILQISKIRKKSGHSADLANESELAYQEKVSIAKLNTTSGGSLIALAEDYPQSISTSIRKDLISEFNRLEVQVVSAINRRNHYVSELNTQIEIFPNNLFIALLFPKIKVTTYRNSL